MRGFELCLLANVAVAEVASASLAKHLGQRNSGVSARVDSGRVCQGSLHRWDSNACIEIELVNPKAVEDSVLDGIATWTSGVIKNAAAEAGVFRTFDDEADDDVFLAWGEDGVELQLYVSSVRERFGGFGGLGHLGLWRAFVPALEREGIPVRVESDPVRFGRGQAASLDSWDPLVGGGSGWDALLLNLFTSPNADGTAWLVASDVGQIDRLTQHLRVARFPSGDTGQSWVEAVEDSLQGTYRQRSDGNHHHLNRIVVLLGMERHVIWQRKAALPTLSSIQHARHGSLTDAGWNEFRVD